MSKINLIIAETDNEYLNGLVNYITNNFEDTFRITCFTKREYLEEYINSNRAIDILLIKREIYYEDISKSQIKAIIILSQNSRLDEVKDYPVLKKYQTGERLCKEILDIYYDCNPKENIKEEVNTDSTILSVYSPVGGIGKSAIAISIALNLCEQKKEVLYLNLEDLQSTAAFFKYNTNKNMSDLLYFVKERDNSFKGVVEDIVIKDEETGVSYFAPVDSVLDMENLTEEDIKFMLDKIVAIQMFKYIVVDLSSRFNSIYKVIFGMSSKVIVPLGQSRLAGIKLESLLGQLDELSNIFFIQNKYRSNYETAIPEALIKEKKPIIQKIYYDDALENIDGIDCIKNKAKIFYRGIDELVMKLLL